MHWLPFRPSSVERILWARIRFCMAAVLRSKNVGGGSGWLSQKNVSFSLIRRR